MFLHIICCCIIITFDGIAINTSVQTTFISPDINTFDTVADITLVFMAQSETLGDCVKILIFAS